MWVALSGGGTRAAALAWAVLHEFQRVHFAVEVGGTTRTTNLADEIDHLSGISGGSFAAAAWTLFQGDPNRRARFEECFVRRNVQRALVRRATLSRGAVRLLTSAYSRSDLAAELYDREVFDGLTFGDLPPRPGLHLHATHLALGERFTFSRAIFDQLGSSIDTYPVGYACAASSALPIVLSPLTLRNHGTPLSLEQLCATDPIYRRAALDAREQIEQDLRRRRREYFNDKTDNPYIHLADGGLVDNQGLQAMLDEFEGNGLIQRRMNDAAHPLKRLVLVNVNAGTQKPDHSGQRARPPSWRSVMRSTMVASMDVLSAKRWMRIQEHCQALYGPVRDGDSGLAYGSMDKPYTVEISFRNLEDADLRKRCNAIPTSFRLRSGDLEAIAEAARQLVDTETHISRLQQATPGGH